MRYDRQALFLGKNDEKLRKKTIAVIGVGALGSLAAELLARAGVNLILIDYDIIELTNLQRQTLFDEDDINKLKAIRAKEKLEKINSKIKIKSYAIDLDYNNINLIKSDLILDCVDNLETRFLLNEFAVKNKIPLVHGAAIKDKGTLMNIINKPCFRCIFKEAENLETCDTIGVLNTITSLIASLQVNEAIKILLNKNYEKDLIRIDLSKNKFEKFKINKNKDCPVCNGKYEYLQGKKSKIIKLCGRNSYQIKGNNNLEDLRKRLKGKDFGFALQYKEMLIFKDRVMIKANDEREAKSLYYKYIGR